MRLHGPNVVSYKVVTGRKRTLLIGAYLPHYNLEIFPDLEEALKRFRDQDLIVLGDPNVEIGQAQNFHSQQVADLLMEFGLMDLLHHF